MPEGTSISLSTDNGSISTSTNLTVPSTNIPITDPGSPLIYPVFIEADAEPSAGILTVDIQTPGGTQTTYFVTVND